MREKTQRRWFNFSRPSTLQDVLRAIAEWSESWRSQGRVRQFGIRDATSEQLAGGIELRLTSPRSASISFVVFPPFRGRGWASRATRLVIDYAQRCHHVETFVAIFDAANVASRVTVERSGFQLAGPAGIDDYRPEDKTGEMVHYVRGTVAE